MNKEAKPKPALSDAELHAIDAWWRAANYLSAGQIFLLDNPLLETPLAAEHIKPRRLGHWGTTPGLNLLYAHMNRLIKREDLRASCKTLAGRWLNLKSNGVSSRIVTTQRAMGVSSRIVTTRKAA